jgi:hypothetical protein
MANDNSKLDELKALHSQLSATIADMEKGEDVSGAVWEYDAADAPQAVLWYIAYGTERQGI